MKAITMLNEEWLRYAFSIHLQQNHTWYDKPKGPAAVDSREDIGLVGSAGQSGRIW
jgi:hypothetical protein